MTNESTKFKHLTDECRQTIQDGLHSGYTFKQITRRVGIDPTNISKGVKKHFEIRPAKDEAKTQQRFAKSP